MPISPENQTDVRLGADYAFGPISSSHLRSAGVDWVLRYLCNSPSRGLNSKLLTRGEADELQGGGIDIVSNWQLEKNDWLGGAWAGREYARRARDAHYAAGGPRGATIVFSIDSDWAGVDHGACYDYFEAINVEFGGEFRTAAYGGRETLASLASRGLVGPDCMQTASWSGARRDDSGWPTSADWLAWPTMRQMTVDSVRHVAIGGVSVDLDWALPGCRAFWSTADDPAEWDRVYAEFRP